MLERERERERALEFWHDQSSHKFIQTTVRAKVFNVEPLGQRKSNTKLKMDSVYSWKKKYKQCVFGKNSASLVVKDIKIQNKFLFLPIKLLYIFKKA